jgi:TDG/mug DNA glycosylase family protein
MSVLPDLLQPGLDLVFCGTAASAKSAEVGAYYAGPGNRFWLTLFEIGLTPHLLEPADFPELLAYGIGLTDIAKHHSGNDSDLTNQAFDADSLRQKIIHFTPRLLAFNGKRAAQEFLQIKQLQYGQQSVMIEKTNLFVLPSTSGAARKFWDVAYWHELSALVNNLRGEIFDGYA